MFWTQTKKEIKMKNYVGENFVPMQIPLSMFGAVCALLGGASLTTMTAANTAVEGPKASPTVETATEQASSTETSAPVTASTADVDTGSPDMDAHGHAWDETLHASTKGTTKEGLWRMKIGVSRPAPILGFPKSEIPDTGTTTNGEVSQPEPSAVSQTAMEQASAQTGTAEDDEFAAFRNAAADADATAAAAKASVPVRKWTDADLGALCNAAAVKLGDPAPVKELIVAYIPDGEVAHSRNIPEENREAFAKAVEAKAVIDFTG
jgi:hypothetical protein